MIVFYRTQYVHLSSKLKFICPYLLIWSIVLLLSAIENAWNAYFNSDLSCQHLAQEFFLQILKHCDVFGYFDSFR